jgi:predicted nuclease of restriction endonuclease-like (RecB) superfamily
MATLKKQEDFNHSDKRYRTFLEETKKKIYSTRIQATKAVTREQIALYQWLGQHIVETQAKHNWGKSIVERLSKDLRESFGTAFGFSAQNLWYMRQFYLEYRNHPNLQQLVGEIPWGQNLVILSKVKEPSAREYYLKTTIQMGWTRDILALQIASEAYERHQLAPKPHNFQQTLPPPLAERGKTAMKDVYMLDMLGIAQPIIEAELERRMVSKIKEVMLELGFGFSFIGNQYRITCQGSDYFIDLLFFNRRLKALVALELKRGKFLPEYAGKMNFYLNLLDDFVKEPGENPSIGIILCSERNHFEVEYALRGLDKPVGVADFTLSKTLPKKFHDKLPDPKKLEAELFKEMGAMLANIPPAKATETTSP